MAKRTRQPQPQPAKKPVVRNDDMQVSGIRPRSMNYSAELMLSGGMMLPQPTLVGQYTGNGFARLICSKPAEEMMRAGFDIESETISEDAISAVKARFEELNVTKHFIKAINWRRAFGGSLIVLGLNDGNSSLEQALNEDAIKSIDFLRVYDCYEASPESRYEDIKNPKFGDVELWKIAAKNGAQSYLVHETRVLQFDGEDVPNSMRDMNNGWGSSVIQNCYKQLNELNEAHKWSTILLKKMQQAVHKIPNLSEQNEGDVTSRLNIVDHVRSAENTIAIDGQEEYDVKNLGVSGVVDIVDRKAEALSAVAEIPMYVLMGRSVGGMNSTGESNEAAWHNKIGSMQNNEIKKPLDRLISFQLLVETGGNTDGGDYTIKFKPLSSPTAAVQAEIDYKSEQAKKTKMETLTGYANAGMMDQDEGRDEIRKDYGLIGDAPEPEAEPVAPVTLNPGQKLVSPEPGQHNPAPVGNK